MKLNTMKIIIITFLVASLISINISAMNHPNRAISGVSALHTKRPTKNDASPTVVADGPLDALLEKKEDSNSKPNSVSPFVNAAISFAIARYVPEIAEVVMPQINPDYPLANFLVPSIIKYGAYGLGAHHLLKKGLGIHYSDLLKAHQLKKAAIGTLKITPNLVPAVLCHPHVAHLAADYCTSFASSYVNEDTLQKLDTYTAPALIATGALSTLYLLNRNLFKDGIWKKVKRVCKNVRPYTFLLPLATAYNADAIKNYTMAYAPLSTGSHLHTDIGSGVKATIYWGSVGLAIYLFATESLGLANQGYVKKHIDKLLKACTLIQDSLATLTGRVGKLQTQATELQDGGLQQIAALNAHTDETEKIMEESKEILQTISTEHSKSVKAVEALERSHDDLRSQALTIAVIAAEIAQNIAALKEDHTKKLAKFNETVKEHSAEVLKLIAEKDKEIETKITAIEEACRAEVLQMEQLRPKLAELLELLKEEGPTYHIDQQRIDAIAKRLEVSTAKIDEYTQILRDLHSRFQTPGRPEVSLSFPF